ncbi:short-chain dehydrogenase reductase family [Triangularia verruculosa]|uniref:Short-chain dehydrogenase reductase family n=1 Tax=Triangularia verruculosa TaxID=2587418 RepID=A0AAN6XKJ2_9PEZI|nr:short-chain dehydrogenase reductase family [Triangularia verruculosa]
MGFLSTILEFPLLAILAVWNTFLAILTHLNNRPSTVAHFESDSLTSLLITSQFFVKPVPPPEGTSFVGKTALITGSNTGLGLATARVLLQHGLSHLIIAVRNVEKGERARLDLRVEFPGAKITVWEIDMARFSSVVAFAKRANAELERLDIAILNAGLIKPDWSLTEDGHEEVFQVNYLSTALLSILLLPILKSTTRNHENVARLTVVSSTMGLISQFSNRHANPLLKSFDECDATKKWTLQDGSDRYSVSKLLGMMLVSQLARVVPSKEVIINAVDPALVKSTGLQDLMPYFPARLIANIMGRFAGRTLTQGAWAYVDAVEGQKEGSHGELVRNWDVDAGHQMMKTEDGKKVEERLWTETVEELDKLAGVKAILGSQTQQSGKKGERRA